MPEPVGRGQRYMPGLDGLRAFAVAAVIAYHLGFAWAPGGLLGVGVFFTLSGYLITDLLLGGWESSGRLQLANFWARRAKRLLPALFVMLAGVSIWAAVADPSQLGSLRGNVAAAAVYVSNWWLVVQHVSYFARFGPPSPLGHLWSLAIEEQFYLLWPWLLWAGLIWLARRRRKKETAALARRAAAEQRAGEPAREQGVVTPATPAADLRALGYLLSGRAAFGAESAEPQPLRARVGVSSWRPGLWPLAVASLCLALASAAEMALIYHPSFDPSRNYYGTDTRAFGLLFGAALAMVWPSRTLSSKVSFGARWLLDTVGVASLAAIVVLIWKTDEFSAFMYRGGMVLLSVATVLLVAVLAHPASRLGRAMGAGVLRWAGVRSYGIYLWHYPVIVLTAAAPAAGTDLPRAAAQVGATLVLADLSWRFVESPVRNGAVGRMAAQLRAGSPYFGALRPHGWAALGAVPAAMALASLGLAGALPELSSGTSSAEGAVSAGIAVTSAPTTAPALSTTSAPAATTTSVPLTTPATTLPASSTRARPSTSASLTTTPTARVTTSRPASSTTSAGTGPAPTTTLAQAPLHTSCTQVVHLGDSTSESLVSSNYLPDAAQRLDADYARVGVARRVMEIVGGNSIVETLTGDRDAYQLAQSLIRSGYKGCWVIALGTNDAADIYIGSNVNMAARVKRMMSLIGNEPVMWVNVRTLLSSGPYSEANMERWDQALVAACSAYPQMRVFNWAGIARPSWFTSDGIHYNSPGSAPRAAAIADALAAAFPAGAPVARRRGASCVVDASAAWHLPVFRM